MRIIRAKSTLCQPILEYAEALVDFANWAHPLKVGIFGLFVMSPNREVITEPGPELFFEVSLQSIFGPMTIERGPTQRRYNFTAAGAKHSLYLDLAP